MATANTAAPAGEDSQLSFPLPPVVYFQHYTNENVKNDSIPKPPPIIDGEYSMFGHTQKVGTVLYFHIFWKVTES